MHGLKPKKYRCTNKCISKKVSLYLRIPLVGRYVFICFHSVHSQFLQFDFMPGISVWFTVGFYYLETRPVFLILHASYLHFITHFRCITPDTRHKETDNHRLESRAVNEPSQNFTVPAEGSFFI